jgi:hypothetical protein
MGLPSHVHIVELSARDGPEGLQRFIPVDCRVRLLNRLTDAGPQAFLIAGEWAG